MAGWGGVEHHHVPRWVFHVLEKFVKGEGLVQAGQNHVSRLDVRLDVVELFLGRRVQHHAKPAESSHVAAHVVDGFTDFWKQVGEFCLRVHFETKQARDALHFDRNRTQFYIE